MAARIADPALRGRAQLAALQARLADPKQAGDPKLMDAVEPKTVAAWLARAEWARHNTRLGGRWSRAGTALTGRSACIGLALGEQGAIDSFGRGGTSVSAILEKKLMTTEELLALPKDGKRRWLIRGELRENPHDPA